MWQAWQKLAEWTKPVLIMFSDKDPFTRVWADRFEQHFKRSEMKRREEIKGAGHFLQEDKGEELAKYILSCLKVFQN